MNFNISHKKEIITKIKNESLVEEKRKLIIKTAAKLFVKKGFHKTPISEIARESGLTPGTLYNYIREKEDILFLMHEYFQISFLKQIDSSIRKETDVRIRCENAFKNLIKLTSKNKKEIRLIYIETASQTNVSLKVILNRQSQLIEKMSDLIDSGVKEGLFNVENPRLSASVINYLIFYQCLNNWDIKRMGLTDSEVEEYIMSCIYSILGYDGAESKR